MLPNPLSVLSQHSNQFTWARFAELPMNPLLERHGQERGWKSELVEHTTGYSVGKGFWMGWGWKADSRAPLSSLGTDMTHVT